jgi:predicted small lipoprotein YifL
MFRAMKGIFSIGAIWAILVLLAGCGEREPALITPPKDAAAVVEPFLKELREGDKAGATAYVSTAAGDELEAQFARDHKKLAAAPKLTPRFLTDSHGRFAPKHMARSADGKEVTLVYAAKKDGKWTSATVRVYRYRDEPYKVEYWRVTNAAPAPALNSNIDPKIMKMQQQMMYWLSGGIVLFGLIGLALIIWLIRRKPYLIVAADPEAETRRSAATVGD